jgi:hypothetical protein
MGRRRFTTLAAPVATATLALGTAAWAAAGDVPLATGERAAALAVSAQATGPLVSNDRDGSAVFSAAALAPGSVERGEVTIANAGDAAGRFTLSATGATGPLAAALDLTITDVTAASQVFAGKLVTFARADLGTFAPGASHRYRFALAYPNGVPAVDDLLQGVTTSVQFNWDAVATGGASRPNPTPLGTTPTPSATTLSVALGAARKPISKGRLVTWMSSSTAMTARVTGTVTYARKRAKLRATTVKLGAKRRTVRLKLPAAAVKPGAKRKLTVRLTIKATAGGRTTTVKRTLRVTAP